MEAVLKAIEYYLPETSLTNERLAEEFPEWSVEKIAEKTGISERHIAAPDQCSSDLGVEAAKKLFDSNVCTPDDIDYILLCTQSPDYFLPTTACLIQDRLGIPTSAGALDFNLGCSGFVYGLGLAKGLIETGQASKILLITAETYSKFIHPGDKSVRTIFGDASAVTLVQGKEEDAAPEVPGIGPFVMGTDGSGAGNLIVPNGGIRSPFSCGSAEIVEDEQGNTRSADNLYMNGSEIFTFTLRSVPKVVNEILEKAQLQKEDVDLFVFHQANKFMLGSLRKKLKISEEKFYVFLEGCGNTVSATIPIALKHAALDGTLKRDHRVMLVGFGVGYSWAASMLRWEG